jgi:endonuclease/exonuclease/phosphatase family metal-dependent hydrolase
VSSASPLGRPLGRALFPSSVVTWSALLAGALATLAACAQPASPDPVVGERAGVIRLVTWNVHDLFDTLDREVAPGALDEVPGPAALERKLAAIGRVLAGADADVILLQEVENQALLEQLAAEAFPAGGYRAFLREGNDPRGIDVGVLSRLPFSPGPTHLQERDRAASPLWSRELLELHLATAPRPVVVLNAHLVSRLDPRADGRRTEQARRVREVADDLARSAMAPRVVVAGDLNDLPSSPALSPLLGDGVFVDVGAALPASVGWTWSDGSTGERIDYVLVPCRGVRPTRVTVLGGEDVRAASDHRPLVVDLWLREGDD